MVGRTFPLNVTITAIDRLTGPVTRMSTRLHALTAPFRPLSNSLASLNQASGLPRVVSGFQGALSAATEFSRTVDRTAIRIGVIGFGAFRLASRFKQEFIDSADAANRLRISLDAIEGSPEKGAAAMGFIRRMTVETPFERMDIARAFRVARGFGMDPTNGSLQAIVDQTAKLAGTGEDLVGIAMQLGQAWSKGRLMAQDANILVERGVPVWGLLQRGIARVNNGQQVTIGQLRKMSEEGKLGTKAISLLMEQMAIESRGSSKAMMGTWSGMISNLRDHWTFFKEDVMGLDETGLLRPGGLLDRLNQRLGSMLTRLGAMSRSGELQRWAQRVGDTFMSGLTWLETNGPRILNQIVSNVQGIWSVAEKVATAFGGWGNLVTAGVAAYIAGPLISAVADLAIAIKVLNLGLIGTPAGLLLLGGAAAAGLAGWALFKGLQLGETGPGGATVDGSNRLARPTPAGSAASAFKFRPVILAPATAAAPAVPIPAEPRTPRERLEQMTRSLGEQDRVRRSLRVDETQMASIAASLAEAARELKNAKLQVKIDAPRDLRVRTVTGSSVPIDLTVGRHMAEVP